ncbi:hypothetical protein FOA43_000158 [Brettanomyces nanus]|uniref:Uncharacterized protein n=1 Tax=Eeniella nana TaxID=13502 RepID=A0A875RW01_EENNA|nr:uncharacterized protein FOA43_000158 [Brettanomyces nanus]QPG72856.1 hypothetical protein FOA43_000158 [Brettanomyces nanus]
MSGSMTSGQQQSQASSHQPESSLSDYHRINGDSELAALGTDTGNGIDSIMDHPPTQNEITSLLASLPSGNQLIPTQNKHRSPIIPTSPAEGASVTSKTSPTTQIASVRNDVIHSTSPASAIVSSSMVDNHPSRSVHGVTVQHDNEENSLPPEKIQAYALMDFENFTFYVQTMQILLGRMVEGDKNTEALDIHLGSQKAISRRHAKIFYNFGHQRFEMTVLGRNGAFVDNSFIETDVTLPLHDNTRIQIGETRFRFILPSEDSAKIGGLQSPELHNSPINPSQAVNLKTSFNSSHSGMSTLTVSRAASTSPNSANAAVALARKPSMETISSSMQPSLQPRQSPPLISQADLLRTTSAHAAQAQAIAQNEAFAIQKGYLPASYLSGASASLGPISTSVLTAQQQQYVSSLQQTPYNPQTQSVPKLGKEFIDELRANAEASVIRKEEAKAAAATTTSSSSDTAVSGHILSPAALTQLTHNTTSSYVADQAFHSALTPDSEPVKTSVPPPASALASASISSSTSTSTATSAPASRLMSLSPPPSNSAKKEKKKQRTKKVYTLEEIPIQYRKKPTLSYSKMITECLRRYGTARGMSLSEIYHQIQKMYPYYQYCSDGWQSSVRHNLSMNNAFIKVSKEGKGWLWGLDEGIAAEKERAKGHNKENSDTKRSPSPAPKLSGDTKRALSYLQKELVRLTKDRKMYDKVTTTQILTQALAMTIAQVDQAAKNAGIKGSPLLTLIDKNPKHVTMILSAALNAATIQIARRNGLAIQEHEALHKSEITSHVSASTVKSPTTQIRTSSASSEIKMPQYYGNSTPMKHTSKPATFTIRPVRPPVPSLSKKRISIEDLPEKFRQFARPTPPIQAKPTKDEKVIDNDPEDDDDFNRMLDSLEEQNSKEQNRLKEQREALTKLKRHLDEGQSTDGSNKAPKLE